MTWAGKRKAIVITVLGATVLALLAVLAFAILYKTPTCTDAKQNQDEVGIDCGGSCTTLCTSQAIAPTIQFTRAITVGTTRTDVLAYIYNENTDAYATNVPVAVELLGADGTVIATRNVRVTLLPRTLTPLYIPNVLPGQTVSRAFARIDEVAWMKSTGESVKAPDVGSVRIEDEVARPRITATAFNAGAYPSPSTVYVVSVFDANGNVIAASQTLLPVLGPQRSAVLTFTWNEPFTAPIARTEILPVPIASNI